MLQQMQSDDRLKRHINFSVRSWQVLIGYEPNLIVMLVQKEVIRFEAPSLHVPPNTPVLVEFCRSTVWGATISTSAVHLSLASKFMPALHQPKVLRSCISAYCASAIKVLL